MTGVQVVLVVCATLAGAALIEGVALGVLMWRGRQRRRRAADLIAELQGSLVTAASAPRGWPEEQDPLFEDEPQCPAIGTWGYEGSCQYCGAAPPKHPDD